MVAAGAGGFPCCGPGELALGGERDPPGRLQHGEAAPQVARVRWPSAPWIAGEEAKADPFNGHIDEFRISHVQRSDGWIETTWNNMSDPGAFAAAGTEEQEGGEPLPIAGAGVVVCLMG